MPTKDNLPTCTVDNDVIANIRQTIVKFLQRCGLQYTPVMIDQTLHTKCCQEAINRGFPMSDGDYSIRPYMHIGVAMSTIAYGHLTDCTTKMWICLFTAVGICIDDTLNRGQKMDDVYRFNERFSNCQAQGDPVLNAWDVLLREAPRHYSPLVSNLIITSALDFVSGLLLEYETKDMGVSKEAPLYPEYSRLLSGLAHGFGFFVFPSTVPLQEYIQCMPDLMFFLNHTNDIISYYKEEIEGDTTNYLSLVAASRGSTKQDALYEVISKTVQAHHNILKCLEPHPEAYEAYAKCCHGYINFHTALRRYKLKDILSEGSSL
ncbi:isoprenoid synthase domain-containing protein [Suillus subaureus]|uniref:Isoprenoid synthase domain-containing protein n=1 Tax=Suillus subaureus TaxID=48587 RepID=A0A9P7DWH6_9AGAM|nr:isoprenoid synthase domain-containing protein [Suillus subaureus]KAG1804669.1 isoprenoid synthase domain-containing protein [Suillus subaureus]